MFSGESRMRIAIVTSGGDAPGMNAAVRAVVRYADSVGLETIGIKEGYRGLIEGKIVKLQPRSVANILHIGGTILESSRCPEFRTDEGITKAAAFIARENIEGLVVIGGEGSFAGASRLIETCSIPVIGIPATIDNDVYGTETTIGFETAVDTAVSAIDRIRDTALSHERVFVVEVMGRERGFVALEVGLASGAGIILIPEVRFQLDQVCEKLHEYEEKGKKTTIIVVAEGVGDSSEIVDYIQKHTKFEVRLSKLGYILRGGSPTARSRVIASMFGVHAVDRLLGGARNEITAIQKGKVVSADLESAWKRRKPIDKRILRMAEILAD